MLFKSPDLIGDQHNKRGDASVALVVDLLYNKLDLLYNKSQ